MKQASTIKGDRYSFEIYVNGQKKPDLKRAFCRKLAIHYAENQVIQLPDGSIWELHLEPTVIDKMKKPWDEDSFVECIISFQLFRNGEQIAVARLFDKNKVEA